MSLIELSAPQRRTVAAALTVLSALFIGSVIVSVIIFGLRLLDVFSGVVLPLVVAGVIALVTRPYLDLLVRWTKSPALGLVIYFLSAIAILAGFAWFFGALLVAQVTDLIASMPVWAERAGAAIRAHLLALGVKLKTEELVEQTRALIVSNNEVIVAAVHRSMMSVLSAGTSIFRFMTGILGWLICPVYLVFLLQMPPPRASTLESLLPFLKRDTRNDVIYLAKEFVQIITGFFRCQILIAAIQGALYAIAFSIVHVPYGFAIGALMGLLNIVPYLGSAVGLVLSLSLSALSPEGGMVRMLWALGAFMTVQIVESYFITPRIMGRQTGLHPMAIIVAMFFWGTALGGILGILLAVPLTAFLVVFWRLLKSKYIRAVV